MTASTEPLSLDACPGLLEELSTAGDYKVYKVQALTIQDTLRWLKTECATKFNVLTDLTVVDFLKLDCDFPERFAVVYQLYATEAKQRICLKAFLPEINPHLPTVSDCYRSAGWQEREAFDFYGVTFDGHPDLRRIFLPDEYKGHPLRKDYPLKGRGERSNFERYVV